MLTDEEVMIVYEDMQKYFGHPLPDPIHEPIRFAYYVKLYKYYKQRNG